MANFVIHQDSEKENPHMHIKEKTIGLGNAKTNANARNANSKVAFRDVGNVKAKEENGFVGGKKSTVVEQFKAFTVYEDTNDTKAQITHVHSHVSLKQAESNAGVVVDKENLCVGQHVQVVKNTAIHKEFGVSNNDDYILDTTPMSVSDVLSPMSIDNSLILQTTDIDDSNCKEIVEDRHKLLARNDRDRFYEVPEYQLEILDYFRDSEKKLRPKPHYMKRQTDINHSMRTILVDWLVEVSEEYNLDTETLYLSISYIDRFLSQMSVVRSKLQLVGTAAMYIAAKYEEIYPPDVGEFVFITDDTYTKGQVLRMEQIILKILAFDLCTPTAYVYLNTYFVLHDATDKLKNLAKYICELSLLDADPYLRFYPSLVSAAAIALARFILDYPIWSTELQNITQYSLEDLKEVVLHLCKTHNAATTLAQQAIQEKYKADKYKKVSTIKSVELTEADFDKIVKIFNTSATEETVDMTQAPATPTTAGSENIRKMISSLMYN